MARYMPTCLLILGRYGTSATVTFLSFFFPVSQPSALGMHITPPESFNITLYIYSPTHCTLQYISQRDLPIFCFPRQGNASIRRYVGTYRSTLTKLEHLYHHGRLKGKVSNSIRRCLRLIHNEHRGPLFLPPTRRCELAHINPSSPTFQSDLTHEIGHCDAVVCRPDPVSPKNDDDVWIMKHILELGLGHQVPVLGIC
ncbi:hypothetical protein F5Y08DRAFT_25648 [Xylaria arbuscula]|nr:hypothetical protein F5Y08DRAFT_25648 [Xylaria arbuscula]